MALPPSQWPARLIDQSFGMCITPNDFIWPFYNTYKTNYYRPWKWCVQDVIKDFGSTIDNSKDSFKVTLDVQHYRPEEIRVKVANNQILVEGSHEERKDEHGLVARQFTRRYALPDNCMPDNVISSLSSDGVLTVIAKKSANELKLNEKNVPIKLCESCPMKEQESVVKTSATNQKDKSGEVQKVDDAKKNTQIMLKEDHCCLLLKPELLREAASDSTEIKSDKKKGKEAQKPCEQAIKSTPEKSNEQGNKNTSEMLQQSFSKSSAAMSTSTEISEQISMATSSEKVGQSSMSSSKTSETGVCSKTSESIESATSCKSSVASNIKEMSEDLSDFVSLSALDIKQSDKK